MNILVISPFVPYPLDQGGKIRVFNLVQQLARTHSVTLACLHADTTPDLGPLDDLCQEVLVVPRPPSFWRDFTRFLLGGQAFNCARFLSREFSQRLADLASRQRPDLVQIEFSMLWPYAGLFPGIPVLLDAHNIEHRNVSQIGASSKSALKRLLYGLETGRLKAIEERAWRECALCLAVSGKERDVIAALTGSPERVVAAANGVDLERFAYQPQREPGARILLLGGMDYQPNLEAARYFLSEIFPLIRQQRPDATVLLVGRGLDALGDEAAQAGVERHESVADVVPYFYRADILAVALKQGAGTRIKIVEAFAAGLPVVSTSKGCEGIAAENGKHLTIADDPARFASATVELLNDPAKRAVLTLNARELAESTYSWEGIVAGISGKLARIAESRPG